MSILKIKRSDKNVDLPSYSHPGDAGLDLRCSEEILIEPKKTIAIRTGISVVIPENHVGLIWDRSGMAAKHSIHTLAGVIDNTYRGEIKVLVHNLSEEPFKVEKNMKIAQMIIQPFSSVKIEEVDDLEESQRGEKGFGSSGYH